MDAQEVTTAPALSDFDPPALADVLAQWGERPSHAARLLRQFYARGGALDIPALRLTRSLVERLERDIRIRQSQVVREHVSADGTIKLLLSFARGGLAEAVLMPAPDGKNPGEQRGPARAAGCISSQIGCAMGCDFCASTRQGLERSLTAGEMVEQFLQLRTAAAASGRRLHTLVFMGMGEPLLNLDAVITAIRRIAGEELGALGWRQITVSTVGIVPGMDRLTAANLNVHLALSLHAPDDATRAQLIPMNRRYGVQEIMAALRRFEAASGRIPTIEYCLLAGVNDADAQAVALAELVGDLRAHVNLIPYNPIGPGLSGRQYQTPAPERVERFLELLRARGIVAHARRPRGQDVNAACGQLRAAAATAPQS